jgi:hypothetical protein
MGNISVWRWPEACAFSGFSIVTFVKTESFRLQMPALSYQCICIYAVMPWSLSCLLGKDCLRFRIYCYTVL